MTGKALASAVLALVVTTGVPTVARAATTSDSGSTAAVPVCQLPQDFIATGEAEIQSGTPAATVCADAALSGSLTGATPLALAAGDDCGTLKYSMRANDPQNGWFHEDVEWDEISPIMDSGVITAYWHNYTTGGHNNYTWAILFLDSVSHERSVNSKAGLVGGYESGDGVLPDGTVCYGATPEIYVTVS